MCFHTWMRFQFLPAQWVFFFQPHFFFSSAYRCVPVPLPSSSHCCLPGSPFGHLPHQSVSAAEDSRGSPEDHADSHAWDTWLRNSGRFLLRPIPELFEQPVTPQGWRGWAGRRQKPEHRGAKKRRILSDKTKKKIRRRSRPCWKSLYGSTSRSHSSTTNLPSTWAWIYSIVPLCTRHLSHQTNQRPQM